MVAKKTSLAQYFVSDVTRPISIRHQCVYNCTTADLPHPVSVTLFALVMVTTIITDQKNVNHTAYGHRYFIRVS